MPPKRTADSQSPDMQQHMSGDGSPPGNPDEFTRVVRKRLSTSSRTGQACDRCKVGLIPCVVVTSAKQRTGSEDPL